jgi:hypothetical protein
MDWQKKMLLPTCSVRIVQRMGEWEIYFHQWHRGPQVIMKQTWVEFNIFLSKGERHVTMPVCNGFKFPPTDDSQ